MLIGIGFLTVIALLCYSFVALLAVFGKAGSTAGRTVVLMWFVGCLFILVLNWGEPL